MQYIILDCIPYWNENILQRMGSVDKIGIQAIDYIKVLYITFTEANYPTLIM